MNFTNLREYYFQAVSNSSWANEGYIVALDIDDADIRKIKSKYDLVYNDDDKVAEYARNKHII